MEDQSTPDDGLPRALRAVILALDEKERRRFGDFMAFPHFNSQQRLAELYILVEAQLANPVNGKAWEEKLEKSGFVASALPKLFTLLHQRLDHFLCLSLLESSSHFQAGLTLEAYAAKDIDVVTTSKKLRQWRKRLESDRYSLNHGYQFLQLEHLASKLRLKENQKMEGSHFAESHALLDRDYLMAKLKYCCASINEAQLLKLEYPSGLVNQVKALCAQNQLDLPQFGQAYQAVFELQLRQDEPLEKYKSVLETLLLCEPGISREDNFDLFNYLLNLCYLKIDQNIVGFGALTAEIYDHLIRLNLLTLDGTLGPRIYKNIVSLYCREKRWEGCRKFIHEFQPLLPEEERELLPQFCLGLVDFYAGDVTNSVTAFKKVIEGGPEDHFWALESRTMLLKAYFQLYEQLSPEQHEELYRLLDAFRMYVRRHARLDSYHQECYQNFIQYFQQLLRHIDSASPGQPFPPALRKAVENETKVTNKAWLLRVLEEKK